MSKGGGRLPLLLASLLGLLFVLPLADFVQAAEPAPSATQPLPWQILARAQKLEAQKHYAEAAAAYEEYLALRPANDKARLALGRIRMAEKKFGEAQKTFEEIVSKDSTNRAARRGLADALYLGGQPALALKQYEALYAETKDPEIADQISKVTSGMETPAAAAPQEPADVPPPPTSPEGLLARARELEAAREYRDAVELYQEYLRLKPDDDSARYALAHVLTLMGHLNEAEGVYQEILVKRPNEIPAILAVAKLLVWQKKAGAAKSYYERALVVDPGNLEAKRGMGDILYWTGEYQDALKYYDAFYAATQDPEVGQRIKEIRGERVYTPRAPVGRIQPEPTLPFRDYAKIGYGYYDYTKNIKPERDAIMELGKSWGDHTLVGRLEILNRFGFEDVPFGADLYSPLWDKAWGRFTGMFAASPNFIANIDVGGELFQGLGILHESLASVEAGIGYRHLTYAYLGHSGRPPIASPPTSLVPSQDVDIFTPSLTFYLPHNLWLTEKVFYTLQAGSITLSSRLTWRASDRVELFASGAFGTSGERIVAVQDFYRARTQSYQAGAIFPFSENFSGEVTGLYEDRDVLYTRKGANFNLIWHF